MSDWAGWEKSLLPGTWWREEWTDWSGWVYWAVKGGYSLSMATGLLLSLDFR